MSKFKKILAMFMVLCIAITMVPANVLATGTTEQEIEATALTLGEKPKDGTVTREPFDESVSKNHRIPGIVTLDNGTMVASADARWDYEKDGGGMDLVVSRSTDGGTTWNYTYAGYLGDNGNVWNKNSSTLMDPLLMTDGKTVYLFADMFPAGYSISDSSTTNVFSDTAKGFDNKGNLLLSKDSRSSYGYYLKDGKIYETDGTIVDGYTVDGWFNLYQNNTYVTNLFFSDSPYQVRATSYMCMMTSTDSGKTWSDPKLLDVKPSGKAWQVVGPGKGIIAKDGTMMFTAYDGSSVYLVFSKDGGSTWSYVSTTAATNESQLVELNDGTIRMFVKAASTNRIQYIDFTKNGNSYDPSALVNTGVANFSQCMVSAIKYSKTINGKEVVLVCCPSVSNKGEWAGRFNGKIYAFTLDDNNAMTLLNSYQINESFFAYSNMTERADGSIDLLYEDDCISYAAGNYYGNRSHISYKNVPIASIVGENVVFDAANKTVVDSTYDVTVTAPDLAKIEIKKLDESNPVEGYNKSVTYSIKLYDSTGAPYTGSATVKVPVGELAGCTKYIGTVDSDTFAVDAPKDGYFELNVPHFSDVTISGYSVDGTTVDITLYKGDSKTVTIDGASYDSSAITTQPNSSIATLDSVKGESVSASRKLVPVTLIESGKQYLLYNIRQGNTLTSTYKKPGLVMSSGASVDNTNLWTIEESGDLHTVRYGTDGGYLSVGYMTASVTENAVKLQLDYIADSADGGHWLINDNQGRYRLNDYQGNGNDIAAGWGGASTDDGSWWTIYEIVETTASETTEVTFAGVAEGTTTATVGHVTYNITVKDVTNGNVTDFNNIVGVDQYSDGNANAQYRSDLDMSGKVITKLTISENASFHLGVDSTGYDSIKWSVEDSSVASVDQNGNVTGIAAGETTVIATVVKDGIKESISIPVVVNESLLDADDTAIPILYYIEQIDNTTPYYTMFLSAEGTEPVYKLVPVEEGEVIYLERPASTAFSWIWTAAPDEKHALALMGSSGTINEYYPLRNSNGTLGDGYIDEDGNGAYTEGETEYYYTSSSFSTNGAPNNAYKNVVLVGNDANVNWQSKVNEVLNESLTDTYGCDGALSSTRWDHDGVPKMVTAMTFISDPMPEVSKKANGILPLTRKQADFRTYYDGMVATVGEYVYFQVDVTLDRPTVWSDDAETIGAITYSSAILTDDVLKGAYFYTKALDEADGAYDGVISEANRVTEQDITTALNAAWEADEKTRTLSYYVVYEIQEEDIPKFHIENTAELAYKYKSKYSTGALNGSADADATITVVGSAMDNVVVDFGQSVTISGLENKHLKYVSVGENVDYTAKYGTVEVDAVQRKDSNGDLECDGYGYPVYDYTVTYTPTEILQTPDAVQLYGTYYDADLKEDVRKVINGFVVYPATTVHYEEGFLLNEESTNWNSAKTSKATKEQESEYLAKAQYDAEGKLTGYISDKTYNYGYDPIYDNAGVTEEGAAIYADYSSGSYATTTVKGAKTAFEITGTGFEVFADCTPDTGYVSVQVENAAGKIVKFYMVNTVAANGDTTATDGQATDLYGIPIVSENGLDYGTYTVVLTKIKDNLPVYIDGVRVFNTVEDSSIYTIDKEDNPEFYQLRDVVLKALNVENVIDSEYGSISEMAQQVYGEITNDSEQPAAILTDSAYAGDIDVQDLLDNGPKNELFLRKGQTLVFSVATDRLMQIGLKAPNGNTSYEITVNGTKLSTDPVALKTSVDMFYSLNSDALEDQTYTITVTNKGDEILSVTDLKICDDPNASFNNLSEQDIEYALKAMGYGPEEADATLNIALNDASGNVLATTSLTANGVVGETNTFTAVAIEEAVATLVPEGYELKDASYADQDVAYGEEATVTFTAEEIVEEEPETETGVIGTIISAIKNILGKLFGWL